MALASFDSSFSFSQESVARLGEGALGEKLTDEQRKKLNASKAMDVQRRVDELCQQFTDERDEKRRKNDGLFTPEETDFEAPKAFEYEKAVNYYEVLGVDEYASLDEVKNAYRKLSVVYHPDKTKDMTPAQQEDYATIFIAMKNAYLVLGDKATRRQYDRDRDYDRAKSEINGVKVHEKQTLDLTEVLKRIEEMRKPPGKLIELPIQCKLEKFFYGGVKVVSRKRVVKDFYEGMVVTEHAYRIQIPPGAGEPLTSTFKEQGDHHEDTRPDTVAFQVASKPHPTLDRQGSDLLLRQEISLGGGAIREPFVAAATPSLRGRHLLFWGQNPFFHADPAKGGAISLFVKGEGLGKDGRLRCVCRLEAEEGKVADAFSSREDARAFLQELVQAHQAWVASSPRSVANLWGSTLELVRTRCGADATHRTMHQQIAFALKRVEGEWALAAKVASLVAEGGQLGRPSLKRFLERNQLGPTGDITEAGSDDEADSRQGGGLSASGHGAGRQTPPAMQRRAQRHQEQLEAAAICDMHLEPLGAPLALFTQPACTLAFYASQPVQNGASTARMFAISVSSAACARKKAVAEWETLQKSLVPWLQQTAFYMSRVALGILPRPIADFPHLAQRPSKSAPAQTDWEGHLSGLLGVGERRRREAFRREQSVREEQDAASAQRPVPWNALGGEAYRGGDYFTAQLCYARCLEASPEADTEAAAVALSNRAACLAKLGHFEEALSDARRAAEARAAWWRPWSRVGLAAAHLGEEHRQEAFDAFFKAASLEPTGANLEALQAAAAAAGSPGAEAAGEECSKGSQAMREKRWGAAAAHYTVALALAPPPPRGAPAEKHSMLHANRAAALSSLGRWTEAVADGRAAVAACPSSVKAHNRLGVALLGAGQVEQAYADFAWSLQIDGSNAVARRGQETCIATLPLWRSKSAQRRLRDRFSMDASRPLSSAKVHAISDVNFDRKANEEWVTAIDDFDYQDAVLILAGNVADTMYSLARGLRVLRSKFRRVFFVPGNRDVYLNPSEVRTAAFPDSLAKFLAILQICDDLQVDVFPAAICKGVSVAPLFSWYNADFDKKSRFDPNNNPDYLCVWPLDPHAQLWKYMMKLNDAHLDRSHQGTVITFSHFVPLSSLPFQTEAKAAQTMGCEDIEDQVRMLRSSMHIYGHARMRTAEEHGKIMFVNHHHADGSIEGAQPSLLLVFDGSQGGIAVSDARRPNRDA